MVQNAFLYPLVAGLLFALLGWARRRDEGARLPWAAALGWGLAFGLALYAVKGRWAPWPPKESSHWLFYATLLAIPIAATQGLWRSVPHFLLGTGLIAAFVWFASGSLRKFEWEGNEAWQIPAVVAGIGAAALVLNSDLVRARSRGVQVPGAYALTLGAAAYVLGQSTGGSANMAGGMAALGGLWCLLALLRPKHAVAYGASLPFTLGLGGLLFLGVFFAETPRVAAVCLLLAPQGIRLGWWLPKPSLAFGVSLLGCAALCAAAIYFGAPPPKPEWY